MCLICLLLCCQINSVLIKYHKTGFIITSTTHLCSMQLLKFRKCFPLTSLCDYGFFSALNNITYTSNRIKKNLHCDSIRNNHIIKRICSTSGSNMNPGDIIEIDCR